MSSLMFRNVVAGVDEASIRIDPPPPPFWKLIGARFSNDRVSCVAMLITPLLAAPTVSEKYATFLPIVFTIMLS